ncbi:MAG: hypothetical protein Q9226_003439 [Calogaya cf. arnoldii]
MYSIFANVSSTYAPQFATMTQGIAFGRRLFEAFLTGFAIAIAFAKREIAYGKLDASELSDLVKLMREAMLPIIGMSSVADIFSRVAERRVKTTEKEQWSQIMKTLHQPFEVWTQWMNQGLQHVLFALELGNNSTKRDKKTVHSKNANVSDLEANGDAIEPGDERFAGVLSTKIDQFYEQRRVTLDAWCHQKGSELQYQQQRRSGLGSGMEITDHERYQRQLYLILYNEKVHLYSDLSYFSTSAHDDEDDPEHASWPKTFAQLVRSVDATSQELTSTLSLLSATVTNGTPLPSYLRAPEAYRLSAKLEAINADILHTSHITEPGYAAFAVMQIACSLISDDMGKLIQ